jgi:hypothetical protein
VADCFEHGSEKLPPMKLGKILEYHRSSWIDKKEPAVYGQVVSKRLSVFVVFW